MKDFFHDKVRAKVINSSFHYLIMSRSSNKGSFSAKKSFAPPCTHCCNLGLSTDHALRASADPKSAITCPVLLATECKYCLKRGHTISHCSAKTAAEQYGHNEVVKPSPFRFLNKRASSASVVSERGINRIMHNAFSALNDDSDEDEIPEKICGEKRKIVQEDFPARISVEKPPAPTSNMTFAEALAKPIQDVPSYVPTSTSSLSYYIHSCQTNMNIPRNPTTYKFKKNWCDYDSDDE